MEYANGSKFNLSAEYLRIHSPAADGKVRSIGGEKVRNGNFIFALLKYLNSSAVFQCIVVLSSNY